MSTAELNKKEQIAAVPKAQVRSGLQRGTFVTFYSFKGGVGRTRALANVAYELVRRGYDVLCIDFDLEAPDLSRYFLGWIQESRGQPEVTHQLPGLLDSIELFQRFMVTRDPTVEFPDWRAYYHCLEACQKSFRPGQGGTTPGQLSFMPSGRQDADYPNRLAAMDWTHFYENLDGGLFIERLRADLEQSFDFVLVDSRTGFADIAGICTIQLPDILIPMFSTSQTSLHDIEVIVEAALRQHKGLGRDRQLRIIPVPARVDREYVRPEEIDEWMTWLCKQKVAEWIKDVLPSMEVKRAFDRIMIRYKPHYAYTADIECAIEDQTGVNQDNPECYRMLVNLIIEASETQKPTVLPEAFLLAVSQAEKMSFRLSSPERDFVQNLEAIGSVGAQSEDPTVTKKFLELTTITPKCEQDAKFVDYAHTKTHIHFTR